MDIERKELALTDWTKGISIDEFMGGSYFYAEGIQSGYDTKGFKLGNSLTGNNINFRQNGYIVACSPTSLGSFRNIFFTNDGKIEAEYKYNSAGDREGDEDGGGALFSKHSTSGKYVNGFVYKDYALGISNNYIDKIYINLSYDNTSELLSNPKLKTPGTGWTIGTGWSTVSNGQKHTTGNTGTLTANYTVSTATKYRVAIRIEDCTAGRVTLTGIGSETFRTDNGTNGWFVFTTVDLSAGSYTLTITPSSTFDGTIQYVNIHEYNSNVDEDTINISSGNEHPLCMWQGDVYIGSGAKIDILDLSDWQIITKSIIDDTYTIVDITQQAGNLIIWATDGFNSKQYYWNGVDDVASEIIEWQGLVIKGVASTETVSYVFTYSNGIYRVYAVNGYQRSLLSTNENNYRGSINSYETYDRTKKFVVNGSAHGMTVFGDDLYIQGQYGVYKYGSSVPGLNKNWTKPIKLNTDSNYIKVFSADKLKITRRLESNDVYYNQYYSPGTSYKTGGYLVTNSIYWDKLSTRKAIEKMKIGYKSVPGSIKIYIIVDDDYFWRFQVSGITNRPEIGDIYKVNYSVQAKIISIEKTNTTDGIITMVATTNTGNTQPNYRYISKVTGDGDNSIDTHYLCDNMCLVKKIESTEQKYESDIIFGKDFVNSYMPYWHKLQFVIELNTNNSAFSPEIYEIGIVSDISDNTL